MPHPIMFGDDDMGLAELRRIALALPEASADFRRFTIDRKSVV